MGHGLLEITKGMNHLGTLSSDPANAANGDWYFNGVSGVFRAYRSNAWSNMIGSGSVSGNPLTVAAEQTLITQLYTETQISDAGAKAFTYSDETNGLLPFNVWTVSGSLATPRTRYAGSGVQNSSLAISGNNNGGTAVTSVELYAGSTFFSVNSVSTARTGHGAAGITFATVAFSGATSLVSGNQISSTEVYNGSTWSGSGALNTARGFTGGCGTRFSALCIGGDTSNSGSNPTSSVEAFNGVSWSTTGSMNISLYRRASFGLKGAAITTGGSAGGSPSSETESFSGLAWATLGATLVTASEASNIAAGTQFAGIIAGINASSSFSQKFNGNSWFNSGTLNSIRRLGATNGSQNLALLVGGDNGTSATGMAEKFFGFLQIVPTIYFKGASTDFIDGNQQSIVNAPADSGVLIVSLGFVPDSGIVNTQEYADLISLGKLDYGDGLWSSTGSLSVARRQLAGCGTLNSGLAFGGQDGSLNYAITEKFNGSAWSGSGSLSVARNQLGGSGIQNAALNFGGFNGSFFALAEKFNGASWSTVSSLSAAKASLMGTGTQNATVCFGGNSGPLAVTEIYNGSAWALSGNLNTARSIHGGAGTQTATICFGGFNGSTLSTTEKFNGVTWTFSTPLNIAREYPASSGVLNLALCIAGGTDNSPTVTATTERFNGNVWTPSGSLVAARFGSGGAGLDSAAITFGGDTLSGGGTYTTQAEKYQTQIPNPYFGFEFGKLNYVQNNLNTITIF